MQRTVVTLLMTTWMTYGYPSGENPIASLIISTGNALGDIGKQVQSFQNKPHYAINFIASGKERAVLEQETKASQLDAAYTNLQDFVAGFYNPQPIVDTIQEHEKYGNDADVSRKVSLAIVQGYDGVANVVNTILDAPTKKLDQLKTSARNALNAVGANLVGI